VTRPAHERDALVPLADWIDGGSADVLLGDLARPSVRAAESWALVRHCIETRRGALPEYVAALDAGLEPAAARASHLGGILELEAGLLERLEPLVP
jgi:hypothetical protein